jgi:hypothetical protein
MNMLGILGALHKAAIVCTKVIDFPSDIPLGVQLRDKYGSGFEISTWSNLPHGSGSQIAIVLLRSDILIVYWFQLLRLFCRLSCDVEM